MTTYNNTVVENLAQKYSDLNGTITTIEEGCLLNYGLAIFTAEGKKTAIVREKYLNEWSSAYTVRFYNKLPKKYANLLNNEQFCNKCENIVYYQLEKIDGYRKNCAPDAYL